MFTFRLKVKVKFGKSLPVAAWRSGNIVGRINEVTLRRVRPVSYCDG